jgi:hypothetical protein
MSHDKRHLFPTELIIQALESSAGVVAVAAQKLSAGTVTITRKTLHEWINAEPELQAALLECREVNLDLSEAGLLTLIKDRDRESIKFYLECYGKGRGWVRTTRVEGSDGGAIAFRIEGAKDELARKLAGLSAAIEAG